MKLRLWVYSILLICLFASSASAETILLRRGTQANLPTSPQDGEPLWVTDTGTLYVGQSGVAVPINAKTAAFNQASFDALASITSATQATIAPGTYAVTADMTIPAHVSLSAPSGVTITVATTKTLTINGPFEAGDYQVFSCTGTGAVAGLKSVRSVWFTGTDLSAEVTAKLQKSLDAISTSGGDWYLNPGTHLVTRAVAPGDYNYALLLKRGNVRLHGIPGKSILKADTAADCTILRTAWPAQDGIASNLTNITIEDLIFDGNWDNQTWDGPTGGTVYDQNGLTVEVAQDVVLRNIVVKNTAQDGLTLGSCDRVLIDNVYVSNTGKNNIALFFTTNATLINTRTDYANASPDDGATKDFYQISATTGYGGAITISYGPSTEWGTIDENNIKIIAPTYRQENGYGIRAVSSSIITNEFTNIEIVSPDALMAEGDFTSPTTGSKVAIAAYGSSDRQNSNVRVIGGHIRIERNDATRAIDFLNIGRATVIGTDIQGVGASSRPVVVAIETIERSNTCQAGSAAGTVVLDAGASDANDYYNGGRITITGGTGAGQTRLISDYTGASVTANIYPNWSTTPDNTSTFDVSLSPSTVTLQGVTINYTAAADDSIDIRDVMSATIIGCGGTGKIAFDNSTSWVGRVISAGNHFDTAYTGTTIIADYRRHPYQAMVSWTRDLATINAGVTESTAIYVPGAQINDVVVWAWDSSPPTNLNALIIKGYVSATNTVTMLITNPTGGNIDLGTDTWKVGVLR